MSVVGGRGGRVSLTTESVVREGGRGKALVRSVILYII